MLQDKVLEIKDLKTYFYTDDGVVKAVDGVDLEVYAGETLGVVGESGCGKSVTAHSIMRLIPQPPGRIVGGEINFSGKDLLKLDLQSMREIRGKDVSMIFQEPMTSLNPVFTVGDQISEAIMNHKKISKKHALAQSIEMLKRVRIPAPEKRVKEYPHQLSGGMRQRVMIAMALSCEPRLLIADEPTTALDVTIQAQILDLMIDLQRRFNMAVLMITHDLGVIAEMSDRVAVMYAGKVVEYTDVKTLFDDPKHPYTWGLMRSVPRMDEEVERLQTIEGVVPSPLDFPAGCRYSTRCPLVSEKCLAANPVIKEIRKGHLVSCWHHQKLEELKRITEIA